MSDRPRPSYEAMLAEMITFPGQGGDVIGGYMARPLDAGPHPGVILIHEVFGLVEHTREMARKFAAHGYICLAPDLYYREGPGSAEEVSTKVRQQGGAPDARVIGDLEGAAATIRSVLTSNGKVGSIGHCSGGRQTLLFACNSKKVDAAIVCYGGRVVTDEVSARQPKPVIDMISGVSCPILGLFGQADANPSPEQVDRIEQELKKHGKQYEFKRFPGDVGHGFFADYRPSYRVEAAVEGWQLIFDFYGKRLR